MKYFAFVDPSGGSADSMTLAVARRPLLGSAAVLAGHWERRPPFSPDAVVEEFAQILKGYKITQVVGDRYAGEWPRERFRVHGISYVPSERTRSEIYLEFLALVNSKRVRMPNNKRIRQQLVMLERRVSRGGRDSVDHAPGAHDDLANAVAGVLVLASDTRASAEPFVEVITANSRGWVSADGPERWWKKVW
jgi:hypothetical protein